jgi:hypothetical protein
MYSTGISAFSTVYFKLFIQRTLVKTQRLNIRIYSDRKNNYFFTMYILNKNPQHLKNCTFYKTVIYKNNLLYNLFFK